MAPRGYYENRWPSFRPPVPVPIGEAPMSGGLTTVFVIAAVLGSCVVLSVFAAALQWFVANPAWLAIYSLTVAACVGGFIWLWIWLYQSGKERQLAMQRQFQQIAYQNAMYAQQVAYQNAARRHQQWQAELIHRSTLEGLFAFTPTEFEEFVANLLKSCGYRQVERVGGAGDLAADVKGLDPDGRLVVVQCKQYAPNRPVDSAVIQQLIGMAFLHHKAQRAMLVTTASLTKPAAKLARHHRVWVIEGRDLTKWIQAVERAATRVSLPPPPPPAAPPPSTRPGPPQ